MRLAWMMPAALVAAGCATLDETECRNADWYLIGVEDGRGGWSADRLDSHREACAELGVVPDQTRYEEGREVGLVEYCTPAVGVEEGAAGNIYRNVCPEDTRSDFLRGFRLGQDMHKITDRMSAIDRDMRNLRNIMDSDNVDPNQRNQAYRRYQDLERQRQQLQFELDRLYSRAQSII